jgi:hypothetical protein
MMSLLERIMGSIDLEAVTKDAMSKIVVTELEMYFVIHQMPDNEHYELIGMTYNKASAKKLRDANRKLQPRIIQFHLGKLLKIVEDMGAIEEV